MFSNLQLLCLPIYSHNFSRGQFHYSMYLSINLGSGLTTFPGFHLIHCEDTNFMMVLGQPYLGVTYSDHYFHTDAATDYIIVKSLYSHLTL